MVTARNAWVVVLIGGLLLFLAVRQACVITGNPHLWPALLLVGASVLPATAVTFVLGTLGRNEAGAAEVMVVAAVGGVVGVVLAGLGEYQLGRWFGEIPVAGIALIEESVKLIVPVAALLVGGRRTVTRGLVLGMASGAGFAVVETLGYAGTAVARTGAGLAQVDGILLDRGVFAPVTHVAWTGLVMAGIGYALSRRRPWVSSLVVVGTFGFAVLMHTWWDRSGGGVAYLLLSAASVMALSCGTLVARSDLREPRAHSEAVTSP